MPLPRGPLYGSGFGSLLTEDSNASGVCFVRGGGLLDEAQIPRGSWEAGAGSQHRAIRKHSSLSSVTNRLCDFSEEWPG